VAPLLQRSIEKGALEATRRAGAEANCDQDSELDPRAIAIELLRTLKDPAQDREHSSVPFASNQEPLEFKEITQLRTCRGSDFGTVRFGHSHDPRPFVAGKGWLAVRRRP